MYICIHIYKKKKKRFKECKKASCNNRFLKKTECGVECTVDKMTWKYAIWAALDRWPVCVFDNLLELTEYLITWKSTNEYITPYLDYQRIMRTSFEDNKKTHDCLKKIPNPATDSQRKYVSARYNFAWAVN